MDSAAQSFPCGLKVVFGANLLFADEEAWSQGALEVLETAGVKTLDTLHKFGPGEELIGKRALSSRFVVDTKYPVGISPEFAGTKQNVIDTAIASLAALKTDQALVNSEI
ncbi:hypothetical protein HK405_005155 [Cladochytrium tenue]|nr:hypothetical protein HK405_005155 [Cladochytrium tenue]